MYIGIDLGTTALKCVLYGEDGAALAEFNEEYSLLFPDGFIEQDAEEWWRLTKKGVRYVTEKAGVKEIQALAISTQGISHVPVDKTGTPLANAVSWLDTRATEEVARLAEAFGTETIFQKTGKLLHPCYVLPQLMYLKKHKPAIYDAAYKILMPLDFLHMRLTGRPVADYTIASGSMLFNLREKAWDAELLAFSGIAEDKLPEVVPMGTKVGTVLPRVAEEMGISGECTVYAGGQDQKLAAIGAGISNENCTLSLGTAAAVTVLNPEKMCDAEMRFPSFVLNDTAWVFESSINTAGAALRWLKDILQTTYQDLDAEAEKITESTVEFSTTLDTSGSITGLTLATKRGEIVRALYVDISRRIQKMLEEMDAPGTIRVFGGGAKSDIWCRILAEITGRKVEVLDTTETASRGAAMLAANGNLQAAKAEKTY